MFDAIAHGDDGLGVPPYNGGLFEPLAAPVLEAGAAGLAAGELTIVAPEEDEAQPLLGVTGEGDRRRRDAARLVNEARALTKRERFLHWPVAFPNIWARLTQARPEGGFDAVIGNPPYVRRERLAAVKPALAAGYDTYAGTADLYVYFSSRGYG